MEVDIPISLLSMPEHSKSPALPRGLKGHQSNKQPIHQMAARIFVS
jgi:hypothetical protein